MAFLKPWHILALLCVLAVTGLIVGLVVWLTNRRKG